MTKYRPVMKVGELVALLQTFSQDMPVALLNEVFSPITASIRTWTHDNYPYDQPDFNYVNLE